MYLLIYLAARIAERRFAFEESFTEFSWKTASTLNVNLPCPCCAHGFLPMNFIS